MSQKDQEAAIDERIERIRKRNEEIQRRYLEVEADKLNAEKLNAAVKFAPSPAKNPNPERKPHNRPQAINRNPRFERKIPDKPYVAKHQVHGKKSSFADNDGPPPDPVYTFLSDSSRDSPKVDHPSEEKVTRESFPSGDFRGSRGGGRGRGWSRGRGNARRGPGNQPSRQSPQMQPDYQAWRAEREKIDQDRITRQKTAEGNWRREWDSKKLSQDNENQDYLSRPAFLKKKKRDSEELKIQRTVVNELAVSSPSPKEQDIKSSDKSSMTKSIVKVPATEKKTVAFKVNEGPSSENEVDTEDCEFEHRNIVSCGDSIKISVSNKPIKSVRVNPVNAAGTGRVGPRQKPRLSYSSQSEDEKETLAPILCRRSPHATQYEPSSSAKEEASKKPPLPPRGNNTSPKKRQAAGKAMFFASREVESPTPEKKELSRESSRENVSEGGDDSWEDMATTSGNESAEYSDADVARKPDEDDVTDKDEMGYESKTESKESSNENEVVEKVEEVSARELSEVGCFEEPVDKKQLVPNIEEESAYGEMESSDIDEVVVATEEEFTNSEGKLIKNKDVPAMKEEESTNEETKASHEEVLGFEEYELAANRGDGEISEVVIVETTKLEKEKKEAVEEKRESESLQAEEQMPLKITSGEKSLDVMKLTEKETTYSEEDSKKVTEEHIKENFDLVRDSKDLDTIVLTENKPEGKVDIKEGSIFPDECLNSQEEGLQNEIARGDLHELKEKNDKMIESESPKVLKACKDIILSETEDRDVSTQNVITADVELEASNHEENHGNDLYPVTKLEET